LQRSRAPGRGTPLRRARDRRLALRCRLARHHRLAGRSHPL